jgi:hypothetical protein
LSKAGKVTSLIGAATGHEGIRMTGDKMSQMGGSIQNYRDKAQRVALLIKNIMGEPL